MSVKTKELAAKNGFNSENFEQFLMNNSKYHFDSVTGILSDEEAVEATAEYRMRIEEINRQKMEFFNQVIPNSERGKTKTTGIVNNSQKNITSQRCKENVTDESVLKELRKIEALLSETNKMNSDVKDIRKYIKFFYVLALISLVSSIILGIFFASKVF